MLNAGVSSALQGFTLLSRGPLPEDLGKHGPTEEALTWVAYLYRMALIFGHAPVPAVGEALGLPKSTANRWITRARDRGLLTVQDKRGQRKVDE
ncbi:hypothetical protein SAMN02745673_02586 [Marinactinospora thermotolerans DSM 45154]|uniref:Uncharacterized protein n=1 Tax=Marinactinospora thermotolerans DSM 45154 TaxID=1122192 RepID=A0A1T4R7A1_9ACTN|nr:hypothetical protein SAMN02745673_02586 [Marinactinospora thermotolerans DSM 45154]